MAFDREAAERKIKASLAQSDQMQKEAAENKYQIRQGLYDEIKTIVDTTVVQVSTSDWEGTAFICHQQWLVAASHLLPTIDAVSSCEIISTTGSMLGNIAIDFSKTFIRPQSERVPDVTLAKLCVSIEKGLPFLFSDNDGLEKTVFLYTFRTDELKTAEIELVSPREQQTLIFKCKDGEHPTPGMSGAPVFEARVLIEKQPKWQFKLTGMVYACSCDEKYLCVVRVDTEFQQVLNDILLPEQIQTRFVQLADVSKTFKDPVITGKYEDSARCEQQKKDQGELDYAKGVVTCGIAMIPDDDVVRLKKQQFKRYRDIAALEMSMLLEKNQRKFGHKGFEFIITVSKFDDLKKSYEELILEIQQKQDIELKAKNSFLSNNHFRVDISGGTGAHWKMDIQDNTGKSNYKYSQVFGIATTSKEKKTIQGGQLAEALKSSAQSGKVVDF